jgi:SOS-response transcriptional repressor LexA
MFVPNNAAGDVEHRCNREQGWEMSRRSNYEASRPAILALVAQAHNRHSKPPTVRDLAAELGLGVATAHSYLHLLAEEGLVEWTPNKHRSLRLAPAGYQLVASQEAQSV